MTSKKVKVVKVPLNKDIKNKVYSKDFPKMLENQELKDQIYVRICEATILLYKNNSNSDEVEVTTDEANESD